MALVLPAVAALSGLGLIVAGGIVILPALLVGTLNLLGFGAGGVAAGSIAAGIQSGFGGYIATGSAFALAQSAAAGGIMVGSVLVQALSAGAMGLGAWVLGHFW
ncbi:hypothetical protein B0H14DRAFT_926557 [Mycena olivaceomarginata]|nr:hypothetical protein B0H14DRAFT_926557 [Mycena olivaceomarginata]